MGEKLAELSPLLDYKFLYDALNVSWVYVHKAMPALVHCKCICYSNPVNRKRFSLAHFVASSENSQDGGGRGEEMAWWVVHAALDQVTWFQACVPLCFPHREPV